MNNTAVDRKTLAWIKSEIDATLRSVHEAPDLFAHNFDDISPIQACLEPIRKVKGAVKMVNIQGALLLAEEMERLTLALIANEVKNKRDAAEVLAAGMLQLPGYLESLYHGQPDIPLVLLPQLNDFRAVQDVDLLTEGEFFSPDLSINIPIQVDSECIISGDLSRVARKLRPGYLSSLLGVIKEESVSENLEILIIVIDNLLIASETDKAKQLWWIASGVIDSLYEHGLEASIAVKILLGRIDRQIKLVIDSGEIILTQQPPDKIIKNLLYYLAQSQTMTDRVMEIKKSFGLDYPDDNMVKKARQDLLGFNANLIDSISAQVNEELAKIKETLDVAMHAKSGSTIGMNSIIAQINSVANALSMLGMNKLQNLLVEYQTFLQPKIEQGESLDDEDLMSLAAALLHIESTFSEFGTRLDGLNNRGFLPDAEYEKLLRLVSTEIISDISKLKEIVTQFSVEAFNSQLLEGAPNILKNITGAMQILEHDGQANLSIAINQYIVRELIENQIEVTTEDMDLLADAIVGLENYYDSLLENSVAPEIGLEVAAHSISQLGYPPERSLWDITNTNNNKPPAHIISYA